MNNNIRNCKNLCGNQLLNKRSIYCSNSCQQEFKNKIKIQEWLNGTWDGSGGKYGLSNTIRTYLLKKNNFSCAECGWNKKNPKTGVSPLQIEHKDGNWLNNSPENLTVLCPNCHSLTETFGSLNKGNGRTYRYN